MTMDSRPITISALNDNGSFKSVASLVEELPENLDGAEVWLTKGSEEHEGFFELLREITVREGWAALLGVGKRLSAPDALYQAKRAGLRRVDVRLCSAVRGRHDKRMGTPGSWHTSVSILRDAVKVEGLEFFVRTPLLCVNREELTLFVKLLSVLQHSGWVLEWPPGVADQETALEILEMIWDAAIHTGVTVEVWEPKAYWPVGRAPVSVVADASLLGLVRNGQFWGGCDSELILPENGRGSMMNRIRRGGRVGDLGFEFAIRGLPAKNLPACLGGLASKNTVDNQSFVFGSSCKQCPHFHACPGLPKAIAMEMTSDEEVEPLPFWTGMVANPKIAIIPPRNHPVDHSERFAAHLLKQVPGVKLGHEVRADTDLVIFGDLAAGADWMRQTDRHRNMRILVMDCGINSDESPYEKMRILEGGARVLFVQPDPGAVEQYLRNGIPLRTVWFYPIPCEPLVPMSLPFEWETWIRPHPGTTAGQYIKSLHQARFAVLDQLKGSELVWAVHGAFEAGRAVIVASTPFTRRVIQDGVNGLVVPGSHDVVQIANELNDNPRLLASLSLGARQFCKTFSMKRFVELLYEGVPPNQA